LTGELSHCQRVFSWHYDYSITVGDDQVAGKNKDAGTTYGKIVRLGDEPSGLDPACAVSVFAVNRYFLTLMISLVSRAPPFFTTPE
jgi:hypothetical protein